MKKIICCLISLFLIDTLAANAVDKFKLGTTTFKAAVPAIETTNIVGNDVTISLAGTGGNGTKTGSIVIILKGLLDQIVEGAEFEVTTGEDVQAGKVNINGTLTQVAASGRTTLTASDEESIVSSGLLKILSVDGTTFTFRYTAKVANLLRRVSNPFKGDTEGTESRIPNAVISGQITGALE